ncbi:hydrolase [Mycobacterium sp. TY815]|uniref:hydrolase n=1 Tax=Mycobacterium sp. TY815 TaxID=3050581 RepID=UPI003531F187
MPPTRWPRPRVPGWCGQERPGDAEQLLANITTRVFGVCDDSTVICPGHGDDTVLGAERPHVQEWRARGW